MYMSMCVCVCMRARHILIIPCELLHLKLGGVIFIPQFGSICEDERIVVCAGLAGHPIADPWRLRHHVPSLYILCPSTGIPASLQCFVKSYSFPGVAGPSIFIHKPIWLSVKSV